jgi:hypothetical protein
MEDKTTNSNNDLGAVKPGNSGSIPSVPLTTSSVVPLQPDLKPALPPVKSNTKQFSQTPSGTAIPPKSQGSSTPAQFKSQSVINPVLPKSNIVVDSKAADKLSGTNLPAAKPIQSSPQKLKTEPKLEIEPKASLSPHVEEAPVFKTMPYKFSAEKFQPNMPSRRAGDTQSQTSHEFTEIAPSEDRGNILGDFSPTPKRRWLSVLIIVLVVLALGAAGTFGYMKFFKSDQPDNNQPSNNNQQQNPDQNSVSGTSKIPADWISKYFENCTDPKICGDEADADKDGLNNLQEYDLGVDPNNSDSDKDGLADGDEVNIFGFNPSSLHTSNNFKYSDTIDAKDKWNANKKRLFNDSELQSIAQKVQEFGFHSPTTTTLSPELINQYTNYNKEDVKGSLNLDLESTSSALDRDVQRAETIKKLSYALLKYKSTNSSYPNTNSFDQMIDQIQPLLVTTAVNTTDPVNATPYIYTYSTISKGADFSLGYYSETQKQQINIKSADAQKNQSKDQIIQRDIQRKADIEQIFGALELYASSIENTGDANSRKYPSQSQWKDSLKPKYIAVIPVDPQTSKDYVYTVSDDLDSFALQSTFENPPTGKKGYFCDQDSCGYY